MKIPRKPTEPITPEKSFKFDVLEYNIYEGINKVDEILDLAIKRVESHKYPNLVINRYSWKLDEVKITHDYDGGEGVMIFRGDTFSYDNPWYKTHLNKYNSDMDKYTAKLEKYQEAKAKYDEWFAAQDSVRKNKEKEYKAKELIRLQKQVDKLQKELK